jgi:hypothetical protein
MEQETRMISPHTAYYIVRLINLMKQKWLLRHFMESNEHDFETCLSELIV